MEIDIIAAQFCKSLEKRLTKAAHHDFSGCCSIPSAGGTWHAPAGISASAGGLFIAGGSRVTGTIRARSLVRAWRDAGVRPKD